MAEFAEQISDAFAALARVRVKLGNFFGELLEHGRPSTGGSATGLSAIGAWAILVSLDGAAADDASSMRLVLKTSETFVRHWQNRPLTNSKGATDDGKGPVPSLWKRTYCEQ